MYVIQLGSILTGLQNFNKGVDPTKDLENKILVEGISAIATSAFNSSKAGRVSRKLLTDNLKTQKKQQYQKFVSGQEFYFSNILTQIRNYLNTVSIIRKNLTASGNSNILLKKLASIETYSDLDKKVKRVIVVLNQIKEEQLIYNSDIKKLEEQKDNEKKTGQYDVLKQLEENLRKIIKEKLSNISSNWWKERIPQDVRENAEQRKAKNESPWSWLKQGELIDYVDFTDYAKIITKRDNWNEIFAKIFHNKETLEAKLKELEPIRNSIMHSRNLTSKQNKRLHLYSDDIIGMIKNSL